MCILKYLLTGLVLTLPAFAANAPGIHASAKPHEVVAEPSATSPQKKHFFARLKDKAAAFWNTLKRRIQEAQDELLRLLIIAIIVALIISIVVWLLPWPLDVLIMVIALVVLLVFLLRYLS